MPCPHEALAGKLAERLAVASQVLSRLAERDGRVR